MKKSLLPLLFGGLGIGITEFVMMGMLPDIANNLKLTIPEAGHFIAIYAFGVVVGAPILTLITNSYPPKKILILLMVMFTLFNGLSAFAPGYHALLFFRFLSGLPHGAFFGVGSVVASRIADKGKESQAVAIMFAGLTIANLIGVPIGTYIGHHYLWRYTFILVAVVGIFAIISFNSWMPELEITENKGFRAELAFFGHMDSWILIIIVSIGTGGFFSWISYIAPLLRDMAHFSPSSIPYIMSFAGLGMVVGNILGGKVSDLYSPIKVVLGLLIMITVFLITIHFTVGSKSISLILTFITGAAAFALAAPVQILMISFAKGSEMLAASVSQACFNIGNALGAFLGGLPIAFGFAYNSSELVGALMSFLGVIFVLLLIYRQRIN